MTTQNAATSPATVNTNATVAPVAPKARKVTKAKSSNAKGKNKPLAKVLHESGLDSPVAYVHKFLHKHGKDMRRSEACRALDAKGIAYYTVRTQYQVWYNDPKASAKKYGPKVAKAKPAVTATETAAK